MSEDGWKWFLPTIIDLPFSELFRRRTFLSPFHAFLIFGTLWWYSVGLVYRLFYVLLGPTGGQRKYKVATPLGVPEVHCVEKEPLFTRTTSYAGSMPSDQPGLEAGTDRGNPVGIPDVGHIQACARASSLGSSIHAPTTPFILALLAAILDGGRRFASLAMVRLVHHPVLNHRRRCIRMCSDSHKKTPKMTFPDGPIENGQPTFHDSTSSPVLSCLKEVRPHFGRNHESHQCAPRNHGPRDCAFGPAVQPAEDQSQSR
jgi:hypothetical protein